MKSVPELRMLVPMLILPVLLLSVAGCGESTAVDAVSGTRSGSAQVDLPFESTFTQRSNERNDGSAYEPCVALGQAASERLGIDAGSVRDAAGTDGQTARGCRWSYSNSDGEQWIVSQTVANSASLSDYKARYEWSHWRADIDIDGRHVGISEDARLGECMTYVQSRRAAVLTAVVHQGLPHPPVQEACDRAIAFTEATIGAMPR